MKVTKKELVSCDVSFPWEENNRKFMATGKDDPVSELNYIGREKPEKRVIPKDIHFIWLQGVGDDSFSSKYCRNIVGVKKMNASYRIHIWDRDRIIRLLLDELPEFIDPFLDLRLLDNSQGKFCKQSDLARFLILYLKGGWYMDTDLEAIKPIDSLLGQKRLYLNHYKDMNHPTQLDEGEAMNFDCYDLIVGRESLAIDEVGHVVSNAVMGATPKNNRLLEYAKIALENKEGPVVTSTGPWTFTKFLRNIKNKKSSGILCLPFFYLGGGNPLPTLHFKHHFHGTWTDPSKTIPWLV